MLLQLGLAKSLKLSSVSYEEHMCVTSSSIKAVKYRLDLR